VRVRDRTRLAHREPRQGHQVEGSQDVLRGRPTIRPQPLPGPTPLRRRTHPRAQRPKTGHLLRRPVLRRPPPRRSRQPPPRKHHPAPR
jgi:hypothetical protein